MTHFFQERHPYAKEKDLLFRDGKYNPVNRPQLNLNFNLQLYFWEDVPIQVLLSSNIIFFNPFKQKENSFQSENMQTNFEQAFYLDCM